MPSPQPNRESASTPVAGQGVSTVLFTSAALAASGGWTRSDAPVDVRNARTIFLLVDYTSDASGGTGGYPEIVPMVACTQATPAAGDATWFVPGVLLSSTPTEGTLAGTLPTGTDFTATPNFAKLVYEPVCLRLDAADGNSNRIQLAIALDVTNASWFQLMAHEVGATAAPGTFAVNYVLGC